MIEKRGPQKPVLANEREARLSFFLLFSDVSPCLGRIECRLGRRWRVCGVCVACVRRVCGVHTHAYARKRTHTHAYARMRMHTHASSRIRTHTHGYARIRTHTNAYACGVCVWRVCGVCVLRVCGVCVACVDRTPLETPIGVDLDTPLARSKWILTPPMSRSTKIHVDLDTAHVKIHQNPCGS